MPMALQVFLRYPESIPQIYGLLNCSVLLHCLLRLALPACLLVREKLRADTRGEDSEETDIKSIEIISVIVILSNLRKAVVFTFSSRTEIHLYLLCRN